MTLPFGVFAATECTPRNSSGWCTTSIWAPVATARSATSWVQSRAKATLPTSASGSPQISPTWSQVSASAGG